MGCDVAEARRALENGEFLPHFQPLVALRTGELTGFEVLARWKRPSGESIPPDIFIPLAERDGWIGELTQEILRKAFVSALAMPRPLLLSVNISPIQLRDAGLPAQIEAVSKATGFPLNSVVVEITESALADNLEQARRIAEELKALGCKLALDDFGTGYSSLRHLQSLPFDELKVDGSFVRSMVQKRESRKIVAAVVGLGQSLGLTTVAEGVETREQAEMLLWLGCEIGQGWFWGKPADTIDMAIPHLRQGVSTGIAFPWKNLSRSSLEGLPAQKLAQLQAVYDGAPVGLGFLDRRLRYVNLNRRLAEIHGLSAEEHLGKTVEEVAPQLFARIEPFLRRAMEGEGIAGVEVNEGVTEAGLPRTFLTSYHPARDEAGEVVGVSVATVDFTARKKAVETLKQYERVVEGLQEMIAVIDQDYRYVLVNRAFLEYRELTREQVIGKRVPDFMNKDFFEQVARNKLDECFLGNVVTYETKYDYPRYGERDLFVSYFPIEVSGGKTLAGCVLRDITDLKRMAQANEDWEKRIDLAQKAGLRIGLWDWDLNTNTVTWSDETYRQWGLTKTDFSGGVDDVVSKIHKSDQSALERALRDVMTGKTDVLAGTFRSLRPDGSTCWIDAHGAMARDGSSRMLGIGVDITDLKKAQESLQESEERYLLLLNSTAEAIYGVDLDGYCTFCNPSCVRMLGYTEVDDLLGRDMHTLIHHTRVDGSHYPVEDCAIYVAIRTGQRSHRIDEVMWRKDGTSFPVEYWSYPMHRCGELVGSVVTFLDISERKKFDQSTPQLIAERV